MLVAARAGRQGARHILLSLGSWPIPEGLAQSTGFPVGHRGQSVFMGAAGGDANVGSPQGKTWWGPVGVPNSLGELSVSPRQQSQGKA